MAKHREAASIRRAVAFCDAPDYVLGSRVRPLTPATYTMLLAIRSPFLVGGPVREGDVRNYIWFHSPLYGNCGALFWRIRKLIALFRFSFIINQRTRRLLGLRWSRDRYLATLALAASEIRELVDSPFSENLSSGRSGRPVATLEASFVHAFAQAYQWPAERTRHMPLGQLVQLARCLSVSNGEDRMDAAEEDILYAHLKSRNEALRAAAQKN